MERIYIVPAPELTRYAPLTSWRGLWDAFLHYASFTVRTRLPYVVVGNAGGIVFTHPVNVDKVCAELTKNQFEPVVRRKPTGLVVVG